MANPEPVAVIVTVPWQVDQMLRDIGLSRADVDAFIHGGPLPERDAESAAEMPTTDVALEAYANGNCADDWRRVA